MPGPLARRKPCALRWSAATGRGARRSSARCVSACSAAAAQPEEPARPLLVPDSIIDPDGRVRRPEQPVTLASVSPEERRQLWKAAIKLPMYSVAIVPVVVSAAAAYTYAGAWEPARAALLALGAVAVIAWMNLSNDVYDSMTGVDAGKKESVVNLTGSRRRVLALATALLLGGGGLLFRLLSAADPAASRMLYAAIFLGYMYQGPPFRLSYAGLGEPICFAAFGPLVTVAFYMAQVPGVTLATVPAPVWVCSVLVGLTTTVILFCSHFHQIEGDTAAGKMSPLVRLGTRQATQVLKAAVGAAYLLAIVAALMGMLPFSAWTSAVAAYGFANQMVALAEAHPDEPEKLRPLKQFAVKWHFSFGLLLAVGLVIKTLM